MIKIGRISPISAIFALLINNTEKRNTQGLGTENVISFNYFQYICGNETQQHFHTQLQEHRRSHTYVLA